MRVGIATDHGGFSLKEELVAHLRTAGHEVVEYGAAAFTPADDYPDFVIPLAQAVAGGMVERGVAICGSGVGASVCANKIPGVRAALIHDHFSAWQGRRGRPHEHYLYGWQDCRTGRSLGSRRDFSRGQVQSSRAASSTAREGGLPRGANH
jgi:RpiB/LacA/LacB family sugar-phosphate isomerase